MDGIFNIDKPEGLTSHDVVGRVRKITGERKAGHAGTLDPMATGVLPVALGRATRLLEYLSGEGKAYRATVRLGATSDTYDREGNITPVAVETMPSREDVGRALAGFRGEIEQLPPMHSAVKVGGKRLYELARQGVEIERAPRKVTISRLDLESYEPPLLHMFVECSKGTYIRSLAHDLGEALGTGAYLAALRRTRHGTFTLDGAITLETLAVAFSDGTWRRYLYPPEHILAGWRSHILSPDEAGHLLQGRSLELPGPAEGEPALMRADTAEGELLAVLAWDDEQQHWHPKKVFGRPASESGLSGT